MEQSDKEKAIRELSSRVDSCKKCSLYKTRKKPLVGDGSISSSVMIIGESPGYYEDIENRAFVGQAGKVLDQLLEAAGLRREDIYITNILKCHPPRNHNPTREQIEACTGYLFEQIDIIRPCVIMPLGRFAAKEIGARYSLGLGRISQEHGKACFADSRYGKVKVIPMYHPAVACYHDGMLDVLKYDFSNIRGILDES